MSFIEQISPGQFVIYLLLFSGIPLLATMLIGVVVSIFQAVTQIQEQSLSFIPKAVFVFGFFILFGGYLAENFVDYTSNLLNSLPEVASK
jgi:flagellar biosynthesis protein FliQ